MVNVAIEGVGQPAKAVAAQVEVFDCVLSKHMLYRTVGDNNNGTCAVHNTAKLLAIEQQRIAFLSKPSYTPLDAIFTHQKVKTTQT